jgi:hypothetical protein
MKEYTFYALGETSRFAIASENQFLNLMESKIKIASFVRPEARISELQLAMALIEAHRQGMRENLETMKNRGSPKWPKCTKKWMPEKADRAASRLQRDFEHLLHRSRVLIDQCTDGITDLHECRIVSPVTESDSAG